MKHIIFYIKLALSKIIRIHYFVVLSITQIHKHMEIKIFEVFIDLWDYDPDKPYIKCKVKQLQSIDEERTHPQIAMVFFQDQHIEFDTIRSEMQAGRYNKETGELTHYMVYGKYVTTYVPEYYLI
jgi:hypothetical protein